MDKYLQAEHIYNKLNAAGAGLGNASIFIIKEALQELEAAQQQSDKVSSWLCVCGRTYNNVTVGFSCPCGAVL